MNKKQESLPSAGERLKGENNPHGSDDPKWMDMGIGMAPGLMVATARKAD
jgi:hypothetical protein